MAIINKITDQQAADNASAWRAGCDEAADSTLINDMMMALIQYHNDLNWPPEADSILRRQDMIMKLVKRAELGMAGSWRPEVIAFASLMEQQLRANDHKPGWKSDAEAALMKRLIEEAAELAMAVKSGLGAAKISKEAADVANFAMMIADVCGALKADQPTPNTNSL